MSILDTINPSLTRYRRDEPAPVLPLRDEPDLLSLLEASGRLVADEETASTDVSTVEEEELSALMGEKEEYTQTDDQPDEAECEDRGGLLHNIRKANRDDIIEKELREQRANRHPSLA